MSAEWRADLRLALDAALEAGRGILRMFGAGMEVRYKSPDQPLTAADEEADALLRDRLSGARRDYGWLSEETADGPARLACSRVWIVDPIDGTNSFVHGRPEFSVSIGLAENGDAVLGVVFNPATQEIFWAVAGAGAFAAIGQQDAAALLAAARRLSVRQGGAAGLLELVASRGELHAGELDAFRDGLSLQPTGSTAYKLARVAAGAADGYVSRGPKAEWDVCAGLLLVREAGGQATDTLGAVPVYNSPDAFVRGVVAARPALHGWLLERVRALGPIPRTLVEEARSRRRAPEER
jgi:myo-inositol-1(or 4)-monophosphatase